ncbi:hypothetical protein HRH59_18685 [Rheinheimera sp. YQF-2]|uniref:SEA domain-containing protein n=1 Tax=Rheinheimera lutimaris TaxID=2740584 RepID=A0A7Y5AVC4_9GAMM|nr:hypothetical protein [Rheinheimera lutimaris]NRQ44571.1 hypothetical protein [Rheinheimera lutimaris]
MLVNLFREFDRKLLKNNLQLALNKFGQNLMYPNSMECVTRRDYIQHRLGAIFQQMSILKQFIDAHINKYERNNGDTGEQLELTFNAINQLSYCFDNLLFNLGSLSDYFGNYLGLYLYGPKNQTLKWNGFVNKTNVVYSGNSFNALVSKEHREWFTKLHEYRGDIIHRKAILVEVEGFENKRFMPHTVEKLNFEINDSLKKYFHIFRNDENQELYYSAEKIANRTLVGLIEILDASEIISFDESFKNFQR